MEPIIYLKWKSTYLRYSKNIQYFPRTRPSAALAMLGYIITKFYYTYTLHITIYYVINVTIIMLYLLSRKLIKILRQNWLVLVCPLCIREGKLILGLKLATAIFVLVIVMVGFILTLHNCKRNVISATGGQKDAGSDGDNIQLPALNIV